VRLLIRQDRVPDRLWLGAPLILERNKNRNEDRNRANKQMTKQRVERENKFVKEGEKSNLTIQ